MNTGEQVKQRSTAYNEAQHSSNSTNTSAKSGTSLEETFERYIELSECATRWGGLVAQIGYLEFKKSVIAAKQMFVLRLVMLPVLLTFYISVCVAVYIAITYSTGNPYWGLVAFLGLQGLAIWGLYVKTNSFEKMIGFNLTKLQIKEAWDEINSKT